LSEDLIKSLAGRPFKLVSNLPYQVASTLIASLLIGHPECQGQFVTIQREVAERLMASPHTKAYGSLTVLVQAMAEVETIARLRPTCFWPLPNVDSAMFAIRPRPGRGGIRDPAALIAFTTALFMKRRKQLGTVFGRDRQWPSGIDATMRPDAMSVQQIVALWEAA
jgi:16S rRNA (adenine1518-N6/adenine1519-N6)-dimethyltransferase